MTIEQATDYLDFLVKYGHIKAEEIEGLSEEELISLAEERIGTPL